MYHFLSQTKNIEETRVLGGMECKVGYSMSDYNILHRVIAFVEIAPCPETDNEPWYFDVCITKLKDPKHPEYRGWSLEDWDGTDLDKIHKMSVIANMIYIDIYDYIVPEISKIFESGAVETREQRSKKFEDNEELMAIIRKQNKQYEEWLESQKS